MPKPHIGGAGILGKMWACPSDEEVKWAMWAESGHDWCRRRSVFLLMLTLTAFVSPVLSLSLSLALSHSLSITLTLSLSLTPSLFLLLSLSLSLSPTRLLFCHILHAESRPRSPERAAQHQDLNRGESLKPPITHVAVCSFGGWSLSC